jgi:hypothetical protein
MDHVCRGAHLVLDQGRTIRVRRNGPERQKKHRVVRGAAPVCDQLHADPRPGLFRTRSDRCDERCLRSASLIETAAAMGEPAIYPRLRTRTCTHTSSSVARLECHCARKRLNCAIANEATASNVRFTSETGHRSTLSSCPLCAKRGSRAASLDHLVGGGEQCGRHHDP